MNRLFPKTYTALAVCTCVAALANAQDEEPKIRSVLKKVTVQPSTPSSSNANSANAKLDASAPNKISPVTKPVPPQTHGVERRPWVKDAALNQQSGRDATVVKKPVSNPLLNNQPIELPDVGNSIQPLDDTIVPIQDSPSEASVPSILSSSSTLSSSNSPTSRSAGGSANSARQRANVQQSLATQPPRVQGSLWRLSDGTIVSVPQKQVTRQPLIYRDGRRVRRVVYQNVAPPSARGANRGNRQPAAQSQQIIVQGSNNQGQFVAPDQPGRIQRAENGLQNGSVVRGAAPDGTYRQVIAPQPVNQPQAPNQLPNNQFVPRRPVRNFFRSLRR